nr:receptor-type tyrosine-protein phosphatase kappa-like isoform X4 [Macaca nemestrina]
MDTAAAALPAFVALLFLSPWPLLGSAHGQFSAGGCTFDDGPGACDYHQDLYDDFEWVHVSAQEPHYLPPEMPQANWKFRGPSSVFLKVKTRISFVL